MGESESLSAMSAEQFGQPLPCHRPFTSYGLHAWLPRPDGRSGQDVREEIAEIEACGFGGVITSLSAEDYLDDETQWRALREALAELKRRGMVAWIVDEAGRPSGKARGRVVERYPEGQARALLYAGVAVEGPRRCRLPIPRGNVVAARALPWRGDHPTLDGVVDLRGNVHGDEVHAEVPKGRWLVLAFVERFLVGGTFAHDPLAGKEPYLNILDKKAAETFVNITYEAYRAAIADYFGNVVVGFHTDEVMLTTTAFPVDTEFPPFPAIPWTPQLPWLFADRYQYDLLSSLPALLHDVGPRTAGIRCDFYRLIGELCRESYFQTIADWCVANGLKLKIHPLAEESLVAQTAVGGSIYACSASAHVPAPDLLSFTMEAFKSRDQCLPAPKMVSSVAHTAGREQCLCDYFDYYKIAAGVKTSLEQARAAIGWVYVQGVNGLTNLQDWHQRSVEDWQHLNEYAARLTLALTGGTHVADLAVLYPITTIWSHYVPSVKFMMLAPIGSPDRPKIWSETYAAEASMWEAPFRDVVWELLEHQRDFDIVDDDSLAGAGLEGGKLRIAHESYKALIIPPMDVVDQRSLERAIRFAEQGGLVFGFHPLPREIAQHDGDQATRDALTSLFGDDKPLPGQYTTAKHGHGNAVVVADHNGLLQGLADLVPADIVIAPACPSVFGLHRRKDGKDIYFLSTYAPDSVDLSVTLRATGRAEIWDPITGTIHAVDNAEQDQDNGCTRMKLSLDGSSGQLIVFS